MRFFTKKVTSIVFSTVVAMLLMAYEYLPVREETAKKKVCNGAYTIIEYGVGVDCNGDTVRLVKVRGIQTLAKR